VRVAEAEVLNASARSLGMIPLPGTIPGVMIGLTDGGHIVAMMREVTEYSLGGSTGDDLFNELEDAEGHG